MTRRNLLKPTVLLLLFASGMANLNAQGKPDTWIVDSVGAVIRGDLAHKEIALVFAGDSISEDVRKIGNLLRSNQIQGSFFLTGNFYRDNRNKPIIQKLITDGHYLGPHADTNLTYVHPQNPDSVILTFERFRHDLHENFRHMATHGIKKENAPFFLTPSELYNSTIVNWAATMKLNLINGSPGTISHLTKRADTYTTSEEIYKSIVMHEQNDRHGLNGYILVFDIAGSDQNHDAFHQHLDRLIKELDHRGYSFVEINELLD
jgi:endoglucanase